MDGEGSLTLPRGFVQGRSPEYSVRISIANTDRLILREIQKDFGGTLHDYCFRNAKWKQGHVLVWTNAATVGLLTKVAPYLRVKSRQVQALVKFALHLAECRRSRDCYGRLLPLPRAELKIREACYWRLRALNARGSGAMASPSQRRISAKTRTQKRGKGKISPEYLAGFIDAEGSLVVARVFSRRYGTRQYSARVTLANTDWPILVELQKRFGGNLWHGSPRNPRWKSGHLLIWSHAKVEKLLLAVLPHLRVKEKQAKVMLDFIGYKKNTVEGRIGGCWTPYSPRVL